MYIDPQGGRLNYGFILSKGQGILKVDDMYLRVRGEG